MKGGKEDVGTLPFAYVEWVDTNGVGYWTNRKTTKNMVPTLIRSIGILVTNNKNQVTLAQSEGLYEDGQFDNIIAIPRCAITKVKMLPKLWKSSK